MSSNTEESKASDDYRTTIAMIQLRNTIRDALEQQSKGKPTTIYSQQALAQERFWNEMVNVFPPLSSAYTVAMISGWMYHVTLGSDDRTVNAEAKRRIENILRLLRLYQYPTNNNYQPSWATWQTSECYSIINAATHLGCEPIAVPLDEVKVDPSNLPTIEIVNMRDDDIFTTGDPENKASEPTYSHSVWPIEAVPLPYRNKANLDKHLGEHKRAYNQHWVLGRHTIFSGWTPLHIACLLLDDVLVEHILKQSGSTKHVMENSDSNFLIKTYVNNPGSARSVFPVLMHNVQNAPPVDDTKIQQTRQQLSILTDEINKRLGTRTLLDILVSKLPHLPTAINANHIHFLSEDDVLSILFMLFSTSNAS